ncbi:MAG: hypothetical protein KGM42_18300 [Hyphomicrobiales bacterium]|nr:hypothetical protein [Hyphomicrobiales bacterium]
MLKTAFILSIAAGTLASVSISSASADEYYVVRRPKTHDCTIVEQRPVDNTLVQVGPLAFKTRGEAESRRTVLCKDRFDDED